MADDRILVARFGAAHGIRGEVRVKAFTETADALIAYSPLETRDGRRFTVTAVRPAGEVVIARVSEIADRNAAERLANLDLFAPRARIAPPEDEDDFLHADLIGLACISPAGETLGTVVAVHDFGAGAMLDMARSGRPNVFVPFTKLVVPVVDIAGGRLVVDAPVGLLDDEERPAEERD